MFLLLFLLASPAFGRPDNSQLTILELSEYFDILYELSELAQRTLSHVRDWKIKLEKLMANDDGHPEPDRLQNENDKMKDLMIETLESLEEAKEKLLSMSDKDTSLRVSYMIHVFTRRAEIVNKNLDSFPAQYVIKYGSIRNVFMLGLDDLVAVAEQFLAQPTDILGK